MARGVDVDRAGEVLARGGRRAEEDAPGGGSSCTELYNFSPDLRVVRFVGYKRKQSEKLWKLN